MLTVEVAGNGQRQDSIGRLRQPLELFEDDGDVCSRTRADRVAQHELSVPASDGDRRAQSMRGVGEEGALAFVVAMLGDCYLVLDGERLSMPPSQVHESH